MDCSNDNFAKWDLLPMSFSKMNSFKNMPVNFIIDRIYGYKSEATPAMRTGNVVEKMLHDYMQGMDIQLNTYLEKFAEQFSEYYDQDDVVKYLKLIPEFYKQCEPLFNKLGNYKLHSYQEEIRTTIENIDFIGYTDFIFDGGDELFVYDLKTKKQMRKQKSDELQQWIYKKALEEKYDKKVNCSLYIVTPKKHEEVDIVFTDEHEIEVCNIVKGMNKVLSLCDEKKDFAYLYQPDCDHWIWNETNIPLRKKIWGV